MKNNKKFVINTSLIMILILAVIGVSYAAFTYIGRGEKVNQITTGTISMEYQESDNVISINNALPTTDETGKVRLRDGEYFDFSVSTNLNGEAVINFEIAAEDFEDNTFDGSNVKFYLTKLVGSEEVEVSSNLPAVYSEQANENKKTGRPANMMSLLIGSTSTQGEETTNYRLRLYVDEEYNPQGDGGNLIFKTRINVYGKPAIDTEPIMKAYYIYESPWEIIYPSDDYHAPSYKSKITSITTKGDTLIPKTALAVKNGEENYFDVSEAGDDSVIAYLEDDESGNGTYKVTIGGKGKIILNERSSALFMSFTALTSVDLSYFDTSNVEDMSYMFNNCRSLTNLNISNFDTSKVVNMSSMFSVDTNVSSSLTNLVLGDFNTSNVTNMSFLFYNCQNLLSIDLTSFDTSNVTSMKCMFEKCTSLTVLNLTSFDISKVIDMNSLFRDCKNLSLINVSSLWAINSNTNTDYMFTNCGVRQVSVI